MRMAFAMASRTKMAAWGVPTLNAASRNHLHCRSLNHGFKGGL